jgi:protein farnesyltransferase subunit beta
MLDNCHSSGFSGSPSQIPHLAPSYAALLSIILLGSETGYELINRKSMYSFLMSLKTKKNSFLIQENGEEDLRATYIAVVIANVLNIDDEGFKEGVSDYLASC